MDFKINDVVIVTKNLDEKTWDFLVGKIGTIIQIEGEDVIVQFDDNEEYADRVYLCKQNEIEHYNHQ